MRLGKLAPPPQQDADKAEWGNNVDRLNNRRIALIE
jgi:hypothetical protein